MEDAQAGPRRNAGRPSGQARAQLREPRARPPDLEWSGGKPGSASASSAGSARRTAARSLASIARNRRCSASTSTSRSAASICNYCNFNRGLFDAGLKERYVDALEREIRARRPTARAADTIYFGGGTPSLLEPDEIGRLIAACRASFDVTADAEVTLETNPETVDAERLAGFARPASIASASASSRSATTS